MPKKIEVKVAKPRGRKKAAPKISEEMFVEEAPKVYAKKKSSANAYKSIAYLFILLVVGMLGAIFYFSFSHAKITIVPVKEKTNFNFDFNVLSSERSSAKDENTIFGLVTKNKVSVEKTYKATGETVLSEEVSGKAIVKNEYTKNQPLVAKTRLLSADGKLFRIKETVNVPAGGEVAVDIYADVPSSDMVIGPTRFTIPGLWSGLQDKIYAVSSEATKYNQEKKYTITQEDIDKAAADLSSAVEAEAIGMAKSNFSNQYDNFFALVDNNSLTKNISAKAGDEQAEFSASVEGEATVVAFNSEDAAEAAEKSLNKSLSEGRKAVNFSDNKIDYVIDHVDIDAGRAYLKGSFNTEVSLDQGAKLIDTRKLVGLNKTQVAAYLDSLDSIQGYEVKFSPSFIKTMPKLADRIKIEVKN